MAVDFVTGVFRITNLFIAIFILLYAYLFLVKTSKRNERRPWDYLFGSAFIFLLYQIYSLVTYFSDQNIWILDIVIVGSLVEFLFSGLVLLAFVSQHDLILRSPLILISRKAKEGERQTIEEKKENPKEEKKELPQIKEDSEPVSKDDSEEK